MEPEEEAASPEKAVFIPYTGPFPSHEPPVVIGGDDEITLDTQPAPDVLRFDIGEQTLEDTPPLLSESDKPVKQKKKLRLKRKKKTEEILEPQTSDIVEEPSESKELPMPSFITDTQPPEPETMTPEDERPPVKLKKLKVKSTPTPVPKETEIDDLIPDTVRDLLMEEASKETPPPLPPEDSEFREEIQFSEEMVPEPPPAPEEVVPQKVKVLKKKKKRLMTKKLRKTDTGETEDEADKEYEEGKTEDWEHNTE
jgi:hypothetical protein